MFIITFDLDTESLKTHYPDTPHTKAYAEIRKILEAGGFIHKHETLYFSQDAVITDCMAISSKLKEFQWFRMCAKSLVAYDVRNETNLLG